MGTLLGLIGILSGSIILTLRSMKEFLPEILNTKGERSQQKLDSFSSQKKAPIVVEGRTTVLAHLQNMYVRVKQYPGEDITIEKIFLENTTQYILYSLNSDRIWEIQKPNGYIVVEDDRTSSTPQLQILAEQFILRHKYNEIYYVSHRKLIRKPTNYIESQLDQLSWIQFYNQTHTETPTIMTRDMIENKVL